MANEITKVTDKNNVDHPLRDAAAQTALTGILNGQSIDSFSDVEAALSDKVDTSSLGQNSGVATLDANGKVPSSQIPAGVGTAVEGNPTEAATAGDLTKIKIDSDVYSIPSGGGGGTTVVPNPSGTATADLNKVQIGTDIYSIPQTDISGKADKVSSPTSGDFASLDSNGNLTDSGKKASDFASSAIMDGQSIDSFGDVESAVKANTQLIKDTVGWSGKNIFDYDAWKGTNISHGTGVYEKNGVTLTSTANDCYTDFDLVHFAKPIYVTEGQKIKLLWDLGANSAYGQVLLFPNGEVGSLPFVRVDNTAKKLEYTVPSGCNFITFRVGVATSGNVVHYENIRIMDADILDESYEPYFGSTAFPRSEQAVLVAKNLLPNKGTSTTSEGITWTVNADGTVQANGTKDNSDYGFKILDRNSDNYHLPSGRYVLSGNANSACKIMLQATRNGQLVQLGQVMGSDTEAVVDILSTDVLQCVLFVNAGQTVNNVIFYPMLRLATDTDSTYAPYAKTNRELTEEVAKLSGYLEQSVTLSTSGTTAVTFTDASITANSQIQYGCSTWGIIPDDITCSSGSCVVTMPKVASAATVTVRIYVR